jgi:hypothetical protein
MTTDYVIPMCPGDDPGADWREMGWDSHDNAAMAHVAWCPNHPGYWKNGPAVMWEIFLQQLDPDEPVPLTLTPAGEAALSACGPWPLVDSLGAIEEWACVICGDAYFGVRPDDDRCDTCRDDS